MITEPDGWSRMRPGYSIPPNQKLLCSNTSTSPYGYAPNREPWPVIAADAVFCRLAAVPLEMADVQYVLTRTPPLVVVDEWRNGPAAHANSRMLVAVAVVTVRPLVPGRSVD